MDCPCCTEHLWEVMWGVSLCAEEIGGSREIPPRPWRGTRVSLAQWLVGIVVCCTQGCHAGSAIPRIQDCRQTSQLSNSLMSCWLSAFGLPVSEDSVPQILGYNELATGSGKVKQDLAQIGICQMMMSWCLMSSDVIWHIRDKLWPMPKHGSINLYVHGNQKAR